MSYDSYPCKRQNRVYEQWSSYTRLLSRVLVNYVASEDPYNWKGYVYASLFLVSGIVKTSLRQVSLTPTNLLSLTVRSTLNAAIYKKVRLKLYCSLIDVESKMFLSLTLAIKHSRMKLFTIGVVFSWKFSRLY